MSTAVYLIVDPDHEETPVAGVWSTLKAASEHCPEGYVILKMEVDKAY